MRLDQLTLTNFRGFESLEITFDPHVTVLVGANMSGKTAVLDGAAIAVSEFLVGAGKALPDLASAARSLRRRPRCCTRCRGAPVSATDGRVA